MFNKKNPLGTLKQWYSYLQESIQNYLKRSDTFLIQVKGPSVQRLEDLADHLGAATKIEPVLRALQVYDAIGLNRRPGEPVIVYIGNDKVFEATEMFEFTDGGPFVKDRKTGEIVNFFDYFHKSDK